MNSFLFLLPFLNSYFAFHFHHHFHTNILDLKLLNSNNNDLSNNDLNNNVLETDTNNKFNKNVRLGRSKDEDGKINIWSVEPKMEVINEEITEVNKNILTGGLILTGLLASLPFLYTLNQYIKNIDY